MHLLGHETGYGCDQEATVGVGYYRTIAVTFYIELSAHRDDRGVAGAHLERPRRILRDLEQRLALGELNRSQIFRQPHLDSRVASQCDDRAIHERNTAVFSDGGFIDCYCSG